MLMYIITLYKGRQVFINDHNTINNACIRNLIKLKLDNLIKILTLIIPSTPGRCWQPFVLENPLFSTATVNMVIKNYISQYNMFNQEVPCGNHPSHGKLNGGINWNIFLHYLVI